MEATDYSLSPSPNDGITRVRFAPQTNVVLACGWESRLRLYDASSKSQLHAYDTQAPALDACFTDSTHGISATLDHAIRLFDFNQAAPPTIVGTHEKPVRCVEYSAEKEVLFSGGWDNAVNAWDLRTNTKVSTMKMPNKVYSMSLSTTKLLVATADRGLVCYDIRNLDQPEFERESSLKYQTRCVSIFPSSEGFAVSSIEGRVAIEYFSPEDEAKKYAFKCHRAQNTVFPVNAIAFHPTYGTFATGGCDGIVNIWDGKNKKRLSQLPGFPTSVSSMDFNQDGTMLAVASSYTFEDGEKDHPADEIFIHMVADSEVKPKPKAQS